MKMKTKIIPAILGLVIALTPQVGFAQTKPAIKPLCPSFRVRTHPENVNRNNCRESYTEQEYLQTDQGRDAYNRPDICDKYRNRISNDYFQYEQSVNKLSEAERKEAAFYYCL